MAGPTILLLSPEESAMGFGLLPTRTTSISWIKNTNYVIRKRIEILKFIKILLQNLSISGHLYLYVTLCLVVFVTGQRISHSILVLRNTQSD